MSSNVGFDYHKLLILSGLLLILSFVITFLLVIKVIPSEYSSLAFLTYILSFLGLYLFIYAYYQEWRRSSEDKYNYQ